MVSRSRKYLKKASKNRVQDCGGDCPAVYSGWCPYPDPCHPEQHRASYNNDGKRQDWHHG